MVMKQPCHILALLVLARIIGSGSADGYSPERVTAILGQSVVLTCNIEFSDGVPVPYIVQWSKQGDKVPIYIWYAGYPPHKGEGYKERISLVNQASINISEIQESDQGWYQCTILQLNRPADPSKNGTWVHLDVHAPPHFTATSQEVYYVKVGDSLILMCEADGTPKPTVIWYKEDKPLEPSGNIQLFSSGHEVRITSLRQADIGDYNCEAKNGEGHITHTSKIIIAGGAVITTPPSNITKIEGNKAEFICEARALPGNITYKWYRNDIDINELSWLVTRTSKRSDGTLVLDPLTADDTGKYTCEVSNGIGTAQTASAHLDVEFAARVTYTPTLQYLPLGLPGIIRCHFEANPPFQFVTWTKDKRIFKPDVNEGIIHLNNGSLRILKVSQSHQGIYTCTPFNSHGTDGASGAMEVLVREPPKFVIKPNKSYQSPVNGEVKMPCEAQGNPTPEIIWKRADGSRLPRDRTQVRGGNLTLKFIRKGDHGQYDCVVQNEVATLVTSSLLIVESTTPHAPTNLSVNTSAYSASISWLPAYDGGYIQNYVVWYRESNRGDSSWRMINVVPEDSTNLTVYNLLPDTSYDFRILARNLLGDSLRSPIVKGITKSADSSGIHSPTDGSGSIHPPSLAPPAGAILSPGMSAPRNVTVVVAGEGLKVSWLPPIKSTAVEATFYRVEIKTGGASTNWSALSALVRAPNLSYVFTNPSPGMTYFFRIIARTLVATSVPSEVVQITVPERKDTGPKPLPPRNVTVTEVNEGIRISWLAPLDSVVPPAFYIIEHRVEDNVWSQLDGPVKPTSYLLKNPLGGKTYHFRVVSRTPTASSVSSETIKYVVPARFKDKAITAGVVGGILFFIVAIILSICAVKICNKRKRRRQERAYSMVACRVTDVRNGGHGPATGSPVPLRKFTESRVSGVNISALRRKVTRLTRLALGLHGDPWRSYVQEESRSSWGVPSQTAPAEPARHFPKAVRYQVKIEYSQPAGYISRTADGRFRPRDADEEGFVSRYKPIPSRQASSQHHPWAPPHIHTIYSPRDPRFRTSSPGPIAQARAFPAADISSVLLPSSAERSFPTTVSSGVFSPSYELPSLRLLHQHLPEGHYDYPRPRPPPAEWAGPPTPERTPPEWPRPQPAEWPRPQPEEWSRPQPADWPRPLPADWMGPPTPERPPTEWPRPTTPQREPAEWPRPRPPSPKRAPAPPHVADIEWREMPRRQRDAYQRIQAQDEHRPLATSSPPGSDERPVAYTRERLQEVIGRVRRGQRPFRGAAPDPPHLAPAPAGRATPDAAPEGDSTVTSDEAFRGSVTSSGRGSKAASIAHSLQGDLEYSPTSRSSSSGFASRNTSQSQPSPHQPIPPNPPALNVSADENYEFDPARRGTAGSDGELYAGFYPVSKYDNVEIERRIPALKEEFHQFRRRQRERRRSGEELMESEC